MSLFSTSHSLPEDNDAFNVRLHEVNKEMQSILERTSRQHHHISRLYATIPEAPRPLSTPPAALDRVAPARSPETHSETHTWLAAELKRFLDAHLSSILGPLVESEVRKALQHLTRRADAAQSVQEELRLTMDALTDRWKSKESTLDAIATRIETTTKNTLQHYQSDTAAQTQRWLAELALLRDSVSGVEQQFHLVEQRGERRMEEAMRWHHETVRSSLAATVEDVLRCKEDLQASTREQLTELRSQWDTLDGHVARLQGSVSNTADWVGRATADLKTLMDGAVEQRSSMRVCRRDVNRLEMLVQFAANGLVQRPGSSSADGDENANAFMRGLQQNSEASPATAVMARELNQAKEQISFLSGRLEGLERHLHDVDTALLAVGSRSSAQLTDPRTMTSNLGRADNSHSGWGPARHGNDSTLRFTTHGHAAVNHSANGLNHSALGPGMHTAPTAEQRMRMQRGPLSSPSQGIPPQEAVWQRNAYGPGTNFSPEQPMPIAVGGSRAGGPDYGAPLPNDPSHGAAPLAHAAAPQQRHHGHPQSSPFVASPVAMHVGAMGGGHVRDAADAREAAGGRMIHSAVDSELHEHTQTGRSTPSQRRPPKQVMAVEEDEAEEGEDGEREGEEEEGEERGSGEDSEERSEDFRASQARSGTPSQQSVAFSGRSVADPLYSQLASPFLNDIPYGSEHRFERSSRAESGGVDNDSDAGSYVSRAESHDDHAAAHSNADSHSGSALQRQRSDQYTPAEASDSESERENLILSRPAID